MLSARHDSALARNGSPPVLLRLANDRSARHRHGSCLSLAHQYTTPTSRQAPQIHPQVAEVRMTPNQHPRNHPDEHGIDAVSPHRYILLDHDVYAATPYNYLTETAEWACTTSSLSSILIVSWPTLWA